MATITAQKPRHLILDRRQHLTFLASMSIKTITADLSRSLSFGDVAPPRKRALYAQRLWAARAYRMVTAEDIVHLHPDLAPNPDVDPHEEDTTLTVAHINDLQSDNGRHDVMDVQVAPSPKQARWLHGIAEALNVSPAWLCGQDDPTFRHRGMEELLRYLRHIHREMDDTAAADDPAPAAWDWLVRLDSAWHVLLTPASSKDTRKFAAFRAYIREHGESSWPCVFACDLLAHRSGKATTPRHLWEVIDSPADLIRFGMALLGSTATSPSHADIADACAWYQRACRTLLPQASQPGSSWLRCRDDRDGLSPDARLLVEILRPTSTPADLLTLVTKAHVELLTCQEPTHADAERCESYRELMYRIFVTRRDGDAPAPIDVAVDQFRRFWLAMHARMHGQLEPEIAPARPSDHPPALTAWLAHAAGRMVDRQALLDSLRQWPCPARSTSGWYACLIDSGDLIEINPDAPCLLVADSRDDRNVS